MYSDGYQNSELQYLRLLSLKIMAAHYLPISIYNYNLEKELFFHVGIHIHHLYSLKKCF